MNTPKATRGRPKTLDRDHIINTAMMSYWADGPTTISLNEVCKRAGVSKPGIYREFGSEDGLKHAVLSAYSALLIAQFQPVLETTENTFAQTLETLISIVLQDRSEAGLPAGCLHVAMCNSSVEPGLKTTETVNRTRKYLLAQYEELIERAKANGEFKTDIPTRVAALYINEQVSNAMLQQKRGEADEDIKAILTLALSVLA